MKKFLVCILFISNYCWTFQWEYTHSGISGAAFDLCFVNDEYGWVVGDYGGIRRTTNGGETWQLQRSSKPPNGPFYKSVFFADTVHGWAGAGGVISRTTNGGTSWSDYYTGSILIFWDMQFVDTGNGWAAGEPFSDPGAGGILKTTDGGTTWTNTYDSVGIGFYGLHFINQDEGWGVGERKPLNGPGSGIIVHTTDGGLSWEEQTIPIATGTLYSVHFLNEQQGFAGSGTILRTDDGGETWSAVSFPDGPYGGSDIFFMDSLTGWISSGKLLYKTTNAGTTWQEMGPDTAEVLYIRKAHFVDETHGWLLGPIKNGSYASVWRYHIDPTGVPKLNEHPLHFALSPNYPNPFNPETEITFSVPEQSFVSITIMDILGREVAELGKRSYSPGIGRVRWNGTDKTGGRVGSGIYFYRISAIGESGRQFSKTLKMVLAK